MRHDIEFFLRIQTKIEKDEKKTTQKKWRYSEEIEESWMADCLLNALKGSKADISIPQTFKKRQNMAGISPPAPHHTFAKTQSSQSSTSLLPWTWILALMSSSGELQHAAGSPPTHPARNTDVNGGGEEEEDVSSCRLKNLRARLYVPVKRERKPCEKRWVMKHRERKVPKRNELITASATNGGVSPR